MHPECISAIIQATKHRLDTEIMNTEIKPKRKYVTLSDDDWSTIRSEWQEGDVTLADLSDRWKASIRSLQLHFERHGVVKGSARTAATLDAIRLAVPEPAPADAADPEAIKINALQRILAIEDAISDQLIVMRTDPTQAYRCGSTIKSLQSAVDALSKAYVFKKEVLGMDRAENKTMPILTVRTLLGDEIERLQADDEDSYDDFPAIDNDNDVVVMGEAA